MLFYTVLRERVTERARNRIISAPTLFACSNLVYNRCDIACRCILIGSVRERLIFPDELGKNAVGAHTERTTDGCTVPMHVRVFVLVKSLEAGNLSN